MDRGIGIGSGLSSGGSSLSRGFSCANLVPGVESTLDRKELNEEIQCYSSIITVKNTESSVMRTVVYLTFILCLPCSH
jgi:hypothetical protein